MEGAFSGPVGERLRKALLWVVGFLALFLAVQTVSAFMQMRYIGSGIVPSNVVSVSGEGEVYAVPDTGVFSFSVVSSKATVAQAQEDATAKVNALTKYLTDTGVEKKDIKTTDYSVYPQYEYQRVVCPASTSDVVYCPPSRQQLKGYEVRQTTIVKVRNTEKAGELLSGVGTKGATEVSGLSFTVEDPDALEAEARDKAITHAKEKAEVLADSLGVSLVRVVSFSESGRGYPMPMYNKIGVAESAGGMDTAAPEISVGQNKIMSNVSITYEIR